MSKESDKARKAIQQAIDVELQKLSGVHQAMVVQWLVRLSSEMLTGLIAMLERR